MKKIFIYVICFACYIIFDAALRSNGVILGGFLSALFFGVTIFVARTISKVCDVYSKEENKENEDKTSNVDEIEVKDNDNHNDSLSDYVD